MNSVMFAALCLRHSVRDIGGSHFSSDKISDSINSIVQHHLTYTHTHTHHLPTSPHASRSISKHGVIILNLITSELSDASPVLPNHIYIEWPKAEEVCLDSQTLPQCIAQYIKWPPQAFSWVS